MITVRLLSNEVVQEMTQVCVCVVVKELEDEGVQCFLQLDPVNAVFQNDYLGPDL